MTRRILIPAPGFVPPASPPPDSVFSETIVDGEVETVDLDDGAVTEAKLSSGVVGKLPIEQVDVTNYRGSRSIAEINALSPGRGWSVHATNDGKPSAGSSDDLVAGDLAEYNGTSWKKIADANGSSLPAAGTRALCASTAIGATLFSPLVGGDSSNVLEWDGTSFTPSSSTAGVEGQLTTVSVNPSLSSVAATFLYAFFDLPGLGTAWAPAAFTPDDEADLNAATTHASGDGSDHADVASNTAHKDGDGSDHADVASNTAHRNGDGSDHADVASNTSHASGDGSDHADVASNTAHATGSGSDHSDVASNTTHRSSTGLDHSYLKNNLVDAIVAIPDVGGGGTQAQLTIDVEDLSGAALAKACVLELLALTAQYGETRNANVTMAGPTKGSALYSDAANGRWLVKTDSNGQFQVTMINSVDETVWFVCRTPESGVDAVGNGVLLRGCVPDSATWSAV
jgi:hypothetical protein